jgi:small subunit ribosomal protein S14
MAKLSVMARGLRRQQASAKAWESRGELRKIIKDVNTTYEIKIAAVEKLNKRPRDESAVRVKRRCRSCGRPRSVYRKFGLCRLCLRLTAMRGDVPGLMKSSW